MINFSTLNEWLFYLESIHPREIDMGLTRISKVAKRLKITLEHSKVITVAGTNGKGTTCAFIENALLSQHHNVIVYSSPHIDVFNERLRINKALIDDTSLIDAFELIEQTRGDISLTYYEYTTLAALIIAEDVRPDYLILEVGLGGRLDATNLIDSDIAVITSIDIDHQAFLGNDRASIGLEKAGIARKNKTLVIGDLDIPTAVHEKVTDLNCRLIRRHHEFDIATKDDIQWTWRNEHIQLEHLPEPKIPRDNVATGLAVLFELDMTLTTKNVCQWIKMTTVEGRTEVISEQPLIVLDVGHNPHAARYLARYVQKQNKQRVIAVTAMLADKDIEGTLAEMHNYVDQWYVGGLDIPRAASAQTMANTLKVFDKECIAFDNVYDAYKMAVKNANNNDMILVFGSFFTVAKIKNSSF